MHLMTFGPDFDLIWGHPTWQQGEISSAMFIDINNPSCLLFHKHARKSKNYISDQHSKMHLMTFDADFWPSLRSPNLATGQISSESGMLADIQNVWLSAINATNV